MTKDSFIFFRSIRNLLNEIFFIHQLSPLLFAKNVSIKLTTMKIFIVVHFIAFNTQQTLSLLKIFIIQDYFP